MAPRATSQDTDYETDDGWPVNRITRVGTTQVAIGECVLCGREHRHGRPAEDIETYFDDGPAGHKSAHCKPRLIDDDAPSGYLLDLANGVEFVDGRLGERERTRIQREEGYVWLDDGLGRENITPRSTRRLEYVLQSLDEADRLSEGLNWSSDVWDGCTVEELLGALLEAEYLMDDLHREACERHFEDVDDVEVLD